VDPKSLADELTGAYAGKRAIDPPSLRYPGFDMTAGYAVEAEVAKAKSAAGHQAVGWKVGYVDRSTWSALGLESLVWAHMYDDTVRYADWNEAKLAAAGMVCPRIEPEIVFKLAQPPASADPAAVLEATEWIALGFEIVDCVFPDWKYQPADFVASRGLHAALIVGEPVYVEPEQIARLVTELSEFTVRVLKNDELVAEGAGANVFKSPALCVGELTEAMKRRGGATLQAGDVITTGGLAGSLPIATGETWIASLSGLSPSALTLRIT
jgi:2-keto-4-pentenoate hydratase